ncbi:MAG: c-type cytochrome [Deltaproteobacteria bacterium]|nr:c-type cytochrome [Deltaproteobacteria bacterium]
MKKIALIAGLLLSVSACSDSKPAAAKEAKDFYALRCATCHGAEGKGDGVAAAALTPKARDFTDAKWQGSVDDAKITEVILEGGAAVGLSPLMAPAADLKPKTELTAALVKLVRSFKK